MSSSVLALLTFAFKSTVTLYTTVRSFRSQDKDIRALRDELSDLSKVLESLKETASGYATVDLDGLKLPLLRCGKACEEYGEIIARCTKHSDGSRPSVRDWVTQKYLQGDITQFREMLAGYKATINVAVAHANLLVFLARTSSEGQGGAASRTKLTTVICPVVFPPLPLRCSRTTRIWSAIQTKILRNTCRG